MGTFNPFVDFLRSYGPCAASDALYDEHVRAEAKTHGVSEIDIPTPLVRTVADLILSENPKSVILTGTAGDGKTWHIRKVLLGSLGQSESNWPGEVITNIRLPNGRILRVIRDLTEVPEEAKQQEMAALTDCLLGRTPNVSYLVAANDGQLLQMWREQAEGAQGDRPAYAQVYRQLTNMLRREDTEDTENILSLVLYNMSRRTDPEIFDAVISAIVDHEAWETGCTGCPHLTNGIKPCPILLNRSLLKGDASNPESQVFRRRLKQAIILAASNDQHVPIRQFFTLAANIILGDSENPDFPLLNCSDVQSRALERGYATVNPYDNALGLNLREESRMRDSVFGLLDAFCIGQETSHVIDELLLFQRPSGRSDTLENSDEFHGKRLFDESRNSYIKGLRDGFDLVRFRQTLEQQRRRAFFRLPDVDWLDQAEGLNPWLLTVFHHAGLFLKFRSALIAESDADFIDEVTKALIKGLNRSLTGMMTEDTESLWLAGSLGTTDDPTGRITRHAAIPRSAGDFIRVVIVWNPRLRRVFLTVKPSKQFDVSEFPSLELRPTIFEYLMRVAGGSLPASFSRQCHQEIRRFSMILSRHVERINPGALETASIRLLSIDPQGSMRAETIEVKK